MQSNLDLLKKEFHEKMVEIYRETKRLYYNPSRFGVMLSEKDGVSVAKELIRKADDPQGFTKLYDKGGKKALALSIEAVVIEDKWEPLFSEEERKICIDRLKEYKYFD